MGPVPSHSQKSAAQRCSGLCPQPKESWSVVLAALVVLPSALLTSACGRPDGECELYTFDADPIAVTLVDEEGQPVCLKSSGRGRPRPAFEISNARIGASHAPADRDAGFNDLTNLLYDEERCQYTLVGWYDPELDQAVELLLEPNGYAAVTFKPKLRHREECGYPYADPIELTLQQE